MLVSVLCRSLRIGACASVRCVSLSVFASVYVCFVVRCSIGLLRLKSITSTFLDLFWVCTVNFFARVRVCVRECMCARQSVCVHTGDLRHALHGTVQVSGLPAAVGQPRNTAHTIIRAAKAMMDALDAASTHDVSSPRHGPCACWPPNQQSSPPPYMYHICMYIWYLVFGTSPGRAGVPPNRRTLGRGHRNYSRSVVVAPLEALRRHREHRCQVRAAGHLRNSGLARTNGRRVAIPVSLSTLVGTTG